MITISYAILACNEYYELHKLINVLLSKINAEDEIVVLLDTDNVTDSVKELCKDFSSVPNFKYYFGHLNKNFAQHKNHLNRLCTKNWIFNIDADEYPSDILLDNLRDILNLNNDDVDLIAVPRVNKVTGLTDEHIAKWRWNVDSFGRVNWPDYQLRLYKNIPDIKWEGAVHERPSGWKNGSHLPMETEEFALIHIKDIERQEKQNQLYETI
jgi:hypothetical protein